MKLLTINTHSLVEKNYPKKLESFVSAIADIKPDIIAMQEVNQTAAEKIIPAADINNFSPCGGIPLKYDNHAYKTVKLLSDSGIGYYWTWLGLKCGYDKYDEGISVMSRSRILETKVINVSHTDDYNNWKTRKIIGIRTLQNPDSWFFSVHYGWWDDADDPFENQWKNTLKSLPDSKNIWLMGDFNNPAEASKQGYDMMINDGWYDSFILAAKHDSGITVEKNIDGWNNKDVSENGMRIDLILSNQKNDIISSEVIFNGINKPVISDHYGVLTEVNI